MTTPWGQAQSITRYRCGVVFADTPGHGGFFVPSCLRENMPPQAWQPHGVEGWAEEDCAYSIVILAVPGLAEELAAEEKTWRDDPRDAEAIREDARGSVCAWYGPDVARAVGVADLAPYEARLRFWAEGQERWGRKGKVAA